MSKSTIDVACLCAAWCRLCDDYRDVLEQVQSEFAHEGVSLRWYWIDIEDEAELVGDVDVETFPTLVIADGRAVRFAGPLTPHAETLHRLLRAYVLEVPCESDWPHAAPELEAFACRLRQRRGAG